jgi:RNA polymerase-interacting CarD/CdnL/TRCF family regulator
MFTDSQYFKALNMIKNHPHKQNIINVACVIRKEKPYPDGRIPLTLALMEKTKQERGMNSKFTEYLQKSFSVLESITEKTLDNHIKEMQRNRRKNIVSIVGDDLE